MENEGRYVRAPSSPEWDSDDEYESNTPDRDSSDDDVSEIDASELESSDGEDGNSSSSETSHRSAVDGVEGSGRRATLDDENEKSPPSQGQGFTDPGRNQTSTALIEPRVSDRASSEVLQRMESVLAAITDKIKYLDNAPMVRTPVGPTSDADQTWSAPNIETHPPGGHTTSVRCDNLKPFPTGVPANKLWETWNGYIEIFEMSANLGSVNDPVKRSQLLYLSVGEELQGIITAAKLRPNLNDPGCYQKFVANIHNYFRSMMDPAAEHENFSKLRQGKTESALAFHARLTSKVRLCGYNPGDHEMFVRSQLLKGLRNQKLARNARIYGQATNDVVQSAGRSDCLESETAEPGLPTDPPSFERPEVYAVQQQKPFGSGFNGKRKAPGEQPNTHENKRARQENDMKGRRSRCPRCGGIAHGKRQCPALQRICAACGVRGHYAAVCREARIRQVKTKSDPSYGNNDDEEQVKTM